MYVCIMRQRFDVDTSYGSWLGLIISAWGWDVTDADNLVHSRIKGRLVVSGGDAVT
jgi:hypothetical protein